MTRDSDSSIEIQGVICALSRLDPWDRGPYALSLRRAVVTGALDLSFEGMEPGLVFLEVECPGLVDELIPDSADVQDV